MIFRRAMEINPKFCDGDMKKLKKWFYYGFIKRQNLSVRKVASVGQKLPKDWEAQMVAMKGRIKARQKPEKRADGSIRVAGVKDKHFCNTDHTPLWYESVGNTSWGKKNSGRRTVKTGGKEKDRFTCQLTVGKDGKKYIPFIIFKGELRVSVYYQVNV